MLMLREDQNCLVSEDNMANACNIISHICQELRDIKNDVSINSYNNQNNNDSNSELNALSNQVSYLSNNFNEHQNSALPYLKDYCDNLNCQINNNNMNFNNFDSRFKTLEDETKNLGSTINNMTNLRDKTQEKMELFEKKIDKLCLHISYLENSMEYDRKLFKDKYKNLEKNVFSSNKNYSNYYNTDSLLKNKFEKLNLDKAAENLVELRAETLIKKPKKAKNEDLNEKSINKYEIFYQNKTSGKSVRRCSKGKGPILQNYSNYYIFLIYL